MDRYKSIVLIYIFLYTVRYSCFSRAVSALVGCGFNHPAARPPSGTTYSRPERNCLRVGTGVPIVKGDTVAVLTVAALPAYQVGYPPASFALVSYGKGNRWSEFQRRQVFVDVIFRAFPPFAVCCCSPPKRFLTPISVACFCIGILTAASG